MFHVVSSIYTDVALLTAAWVPYFDDMDAIIFLAPIRQVRWTLTLCLTHTFVVLKLFRSGAGRRSQSQPPGM